MRKGSQDPESDRDSTSGDESSQKSFRNLRRLTLYTYRSIFLLKAEKTISNNKQLWIDRHTGRPVELPDSDSIPNEYNLAKDYSAFLGIITVLDKQFLMMVDDAVLVCTMGGHKIYSIYSVSFVSLETEDYQSPDQKKQLLNYLTNIRKLMSYGFYFSPTYDLTLSKAKNFKKCPPERQFQWNYGLCKEFIKFNIDPAWQVSLIQGYVGCFTCSLDNNNILEYFLISRRSCLNARTRYYARGLDDDASVANFVETEQIVFYQNRCCSHLQIRGSAPVFWRQKGVQAAVKLDRTYELTNHVFMKHMETLNKAYGHTICVNLMSKTKKEEQIITEAFEKHLKFNVLANIGYEYFDLNNAVKSQKFENSNVLIYKVQPALESFGFFQENIIEGAMESEQQGIVRTNCLDCLDRTNFVQSKVGIAALDLILSRFGIRLRQMLGQEAFEELDNPDNKRQNPLILGFKNIWTENGDAISIHYTGAGSVTSDVTKVGKRSIFGMLDQGMKSINRLYTGNSEDKMKQDCLDFLLGKYNTVGNLVNEAYEMEIQARESEFSTYNPINIFIATWNVAAYVPDQNLDLKNLFDFQNNPAPELVVIGLQEIVELNPTTVMSDQGKPNIPIWREVILSTLKRFEKYVLVNELDLVGILMFIFAREDFSKRIHQVETDKVKTGLGGKLGNKGAVVIKLNVDDTTLCFVNCHLEPHATHLEDRINNLNDIHQKAFQQEVVGKRKNDMILNFDYTFLLGDSNFRLSPGHNARPLIKEYQFLKSKGEDKKALELLNMLLKYDQLSQIKETNEVLKNYQEGPIDFLPTYKYDRFTDEYDSSKKLRAPAWTDRILWSCAQGVEQFFYKRVGYQMSDHRPVIAYFKAYVKQIDKEKKEKVVKSVYEVEDVVKLDEDKNKVEETKLKEEEENGVEKATKTDKIEISEKNP